MRIAFHLLAILLIATSCTIKQEYVFDENFSGKYNVEIDMSTMASMFGEEAPSMIDSIDTDSIIDACNALDGISNTFIREEPGTATMNIGYDFADLNSMNQAQESSDLTGALGETISVKASGDELFSLKGKKLRYAPPIMSAQETDQQQEMESMWGMVRYEVVMRFDQPIKKVTNERWTISSDKKTMKLEIGFDELLEGVNGAGEIRF